MSVIKVSTKTAVAVVVSQFHVDFAKIAIHSQRTLATVRTKMEALVIAQYGDPKATNAARAVWFGPTFEQYKADLKALDQIAKERKLADGQWLRRPYGAALKAIYGALPVSQDAAAVLKRTQREAREQLLKDAIAKAKDTQTVVATSNPVGAPAGETQERTPSPAEVLESTIARLGVYETLYACIRILGADKVTEAQALHLRKMADKAKDASAQADKEARTKAITPPVSV